MSTRSIKLAIIGALALAGCRRRDVQRMDPPSVATTQKATDPSEATLKDRADAGDPTAAWSLWEEYEIYDHDDVKAAPWFERALELHHPEAERMVAQQILAGTSAPSERSRARVRQLLTSACRTSATACFELADVLHGNFFGRPDMERARSLYHRAADSGELMACKPLVSMLRTGSGGPIDLPAAYFWSSVDTAFVDPRSVAGTEAWQVRNSIAVQLSPEQLAQQWRALDAFITEVTTRTRPLTSPPFLEGMANPDISRQGATEQRIAEAAHRTRFSRP